MFAPSRALSNVGTSTSAPRTGGDRGQPSVQGRDRSSRCRRRLHAAQPTVREAAQGPADAVEDPARTRVRRGADAKSGNWDAKDARGAAKEGEDYLYELGRSDVSMNVDTAQNVQNIDYLFTGETLGHKSDIADGSLRRWEFRKYDNIQGDYYISPRFLESVAMHVVKNFIADQLEGVNPPLVLGIWGPKGCGKTFQTELAFKKLKVEPIVMSAGELEHEWAGTPGRLIRERYRKAAEMSKVRGKFSCLLINDIDAGIGHFKDTQVTVNNQIVVATLMNICDNPTRVSVAQGWRENDVIQRIPIIVTGNDFSRLFAPLVRDGRMDKFYWSPERDEIVAILLQMYKDDDLTREEICVLVDTFPGQPLDFFGAIRAATYDNQIRTWITDDVVKSERIDEDANMVELGRRLLDKDSVLPSFEPENITLDLLLGEGHRLAGEQEAVNKLKLSDEYMRDTGGGGGSLIGLQG